MSEPMITLNEDNVRQIGALLWKAHEAGVFTTVEDIAAFNATMSIFSEWLIAECGVDPEDYK
jgi:hypothetical protein